MFQMKMSETNGPRVKTSKVLILQFLKITTTPREMFEFMVALPSEGPPRGLSFRISGAFLHARWMAKAFCCLKISIFQIRFLHSYYELDQDVRILYFSMHRSVLVHLLHLNLFFVIWNWLDLFCNMVLMNT